MAPDDLKAGDFVLRGLLYRWIPNTVLSYDYTDGKPNKMAFRPGKDKAGIPDTGISVFLADLVQPAHVIHGLDGYGVCEFTAEAFTFGAAYPLVTLIIGPSARRRSSS